MNLSRKIMYMYCTTMYAPDCDQLVLVAWTG